MSRKSIVGSFAMILDAGDRSMTVLAAIVRFRR